MRVATLRRGELAEQYRRGGWGDPALTKTHPHLMCRILFARAPVLGLCFFVSVNTSFFLFFFLSQPPEFITSDEEPQGDSSPWRIGQTIRQVGIGVAPL